MTLPSFDEQSIKSLFEHSALDRIYKKRSKGCSFEQIANAVSEWRKTDAIIIFTAGVFDVLHLNHMLALNHYRLLGARLYLANSGNLTPTNNDLLTVAGSKKVKLIVTADSNARASKAKSYRPDKGYSPRPILSWESRVMMLAQQYMGLPDGTGWPLIDLITQHGINSCRCVTCPHDDNADMAIALNPDLLVVNSASSDTLAKVKDRLNSSQLHVIHEDKLAYEDALLQGPIKSTAIIMRAKLQR